MKRCEAAEKMFENYKESNPTENNEPAPRDSALPNKHQLWDRLWRALKLEQNKWWEATTLQKYIDVGRVPRGLRIFVTPTFNDPDPELISDWAANNHNCSTIMLGLLVKYARKDVERLSDEIDNITKQLKSMCAQDEFQNEMDKMNAKLSKIEEDIKTKKQRKFHRDLIDYQKGQILTFAKKYDKLRGTTSTSKRPQNAANGGMIPNDESSTNDTTRDESLVSGSDISSVSDRGSKRTHFNRVHIDGQRKNDGQQTRRKSRTWKRRQRRSKRKYNDARRTRKPHGKPYEGPTTEEMMDKKTVINLSARPLTDVEITN